MSDHGPYGTPPPPGWVPPPVYGAPPPPPPPGWGPSPGGGPAPAWGPPPKQKRFGWLAITFAFLIGGFVSFVVTVGLLFLIGSSLSPDTSSHPAASREASLPEVGDCLAPSPGGVDLTSDHDVVECSTNHGSEVAAVLEMPGSTQAPGGDDLDTYADDACLIAFEGYVGADYDDSQYDYSSIVPTESAWEQGDTRVWCLVGTSGRRGTVRNSHD